MATVRELDVRANGLHLHGAECGDGPPVLLLHGLLGSWRYLRDTMRALAAQDRRAIAFDLPGFGGSQRLPRWTLEAAALAMLAGARVVAAPRAVIVGHSLGGAVAALAAQARPEAVERLVLVGACGLSPASQWPIWRRRHLLAAGEAALAVLPVWERPASAWAPARRAMFRFVAFDGRRIDAAHTRVLLRGARQARQTREAIETLADRVLLSDLRSLPLPLSAIWGERDRVTRIADAAALARVRPDARIELMPGLGHAPMLEAQAEFDAALARSLGP
jgi:abhydrolase domain-containing protein 6